MTFSEYIQSRLMNNDSRFHNNPEFIIFYLWQKEMRELSAGIYNALNSTNKRHLSIKQFVDEVSSSDTMIEANLSTVLQSVRGTKQFWFLKKNDVMAMIRENGSPTLFLTLSCAEYEAPDTERYLCKVNDVSGYVQKILFQCHESFHRSLGISLQLCSYKDKYLGKSPTIFGRKSTKQEVLPTIMFCFGSKMLQL